jgi:hypothetical protein
MAFTLPVPLAAVEGLEDEGGDSIRASRSSIMSTLAGGTVDEEATKRDGAEAAQTETAGEIGEGGR